MKYNPTIHDPIFESYFTEAKQKANEWIQGKKVDSLYGYEWENDHGRHRDDDKPAYINRTKDVFQWYKNGELYRDHDKPSIIILGEKMIWHEDGMKGRTGNFPAVYWHDGAKEWWINGKQYFPEEEIYLSIKYRPDQAIDYIVDNYRIQKLIIDEINPKLITDLPEYAVNERIYDEYRNLFDLIDLGI